jgi:hypothetical protein
MATRPTIDGLAVQVCHAIREERQAHQAWISLDRVQDRLGMENGRALDAAVAFAAAKGWLTIGGAPAHSVLLKQDAP